MINLLVRANGEGWCFFRMKWAKAFMIFSAFFDQDCVKDYLDYAGSGPDFFNDIFGDDVFQCSKETG